MNKRSIPSNFWEYRGALNLPSMTGVAFLLLVFFLLNSAKYPVEADLTIFLPAVSQPSSSLCGLDPCAISVGANGDVMWNGEKLNADINQRALPQLEAKLKQLKSAADLVGVQAFVMLNADDETPYQRFIDVLNALIKVGIQNVGVHF